METIIIVSHEVINFALWEQAFYAGSGMRDQAGLKVLGVYRDISNENIITVISEAPSQEVAIAFTDQPEIKTTWKKAGIIGDPDIRIMNQVI